MDAHQTLHEFVLNLLSNPDARMAFQVDPEGTLHDAGLSDVNAQDVRDAIPLVVDYAPVQQLDGMESSISALSSDAVRPDPAGAVQQLQLVAQQVPLGRSATDFTMAASGGLVGDASGSGATMNGGAWSGVGGGSFDGSLGLSPAHDSGSLPAYGDGSLDMGGSVHPTDLTSVANGAVGDPAGTLGDPAGLLGHAGGLLGGDPAGALGLDPTGTLSGVLGTATHGLTGDGGSLLDGHALGSTGLDGLTGHGLDVGGLTGGLDGVTGGLGGSLTSSGSVSSTHDSTHVSLGGDGVLQHGAVGGLLGQVSQVDPAAGTDGGHLLGIPLF